MPELRSFNIYIFRLINYKNAYHYTLLWKLRILRKFTLTKKNFVKSLFSNLFSTNVPFTKFLPKIGRVNFRNFHTVCIFNLEILFSAAQILREINVIVFGTSKYAILSVSAILMD